MMKVITKNFAETKKIAAKMAREILESNSATGQACLRRQAAVIGLIGDLGAGKTIFAKGFAKGLGIKEDVTSPTFVLEKIYKLKTKNRRFFVHIDAYRIENSKELLSLGFKKLLKEPSNIILIEWADKIKNILPKKYIKICFEHMEKNKRKISAHDYGKK